MKKILFLLLIAAQVVFAQNGTEKVLVTDMTKINQVSNVNVSPDGKRALYTLRTIEPDEDKKWEYDYHSYLFSTDFQSTKQLTRGPENVGAASWSPDGKQIAFTRSVKGKPQIFIMPLDGGEAYPITDSKYGASNPIWSKDGSKILFSVSISLHELLKDSILNPNQDVPSWSTEKPGFANNDYLKQNKNIKPDPNGNLEEIRAYLLKDEEDKKAKVFNRLNFQGEATTQPEMSFNHLFVVEAKEGATPKPLTGGFESYGGGDWLDNGKIMVNVDRDSMEHPDREQDNAILLMNADGSGKKVLLAEAGMRFSAPSFSPDGKWMVYSKSPSQGVNIGTLYLANADGSNAKAIKFDRAAGNAEWSKDSKYVYFTAASNGGTPIYRLDAKSLKVEQLTDYDSGISSFGVTPDKIVYAKVEVADPSELYVADLQMKNAVKLSAHNDWVKSKKLSFRRSTPSRIHSGKPSSTGL